MKIKYLNEIWKDIKGYEGLYQVSNFGRVRSLNYNRTGIIKILKQQKIYSGYLTVYLGNKGDNKGTKYFVHRLVAFAFPNICGEYFEGATVNHKNEIPWDNRAENLHWCTQSFNNSYGTRANRIYSKTKNGKKSKVVLQYDMNGNFIKEWPSTMEIQRTLGYFSSNIARCCRNNIKSAYGYIWKYK